MSLDFDYSKVASIPADSEERNAYFDAPSQLTYRNPATGETEHYDNWTVLETLIWRCMAVGLRGITEENLQKFAERSAMWQYAHGGVKLNPQAIADHIGLTTNVSTETDAKWRASFVQSIARSSGATSAARFVSERKDELAKKAKVQADLDYVADAILKAQA